MRSRGERVRSVRSASRRLTRRLIAESPGHVILVCFVCTIAIATGVIAHGYAVDAAQRLERVEERRHGSVSVVMAHAWFSDALARRVSESARAVGVRLTPRIEIAAYDSNDTVRTVLAVGPEDPGLELLEPPRDLAALLDLTVAVGRGPDDAVEWHTIPSEAIHGAGVGDVIWIRYSWMRSLIADGPADDPESVVGATPVANVLVATESLEGPFSVAYDLSQQLANIDAPTRVFAWPELVGYERYIGTGSMASLIRPLALVVAAVGVFGAVAVATRNRIRDAVLLRTIGFETGVLRGVYVREIAIASITASLLVLLATLVAAPFGESVEIDAQVRRTLLGGALIPPLVTFLTVHRHLRAPLARIRAEADQ